MMNKKKKKKSNYAKLWRIIKMDLLILVIYTLMIAAMRALFKIKNKPNLMIMNKMKRIMKKKSEMISKNNLIKIFKKNLENKMNKGLKKNYKNNRSI